MIIQFTNRTTSMDEYVILGEAVAMSLTTFKNPTDGKWVVGFLPLDGHYELCNAIVIGPKDHAQGALSFIVDAVLDNEKMVDVRPYQMHMDEPDLVVD